MTATVYVTAEAWGMRPLVARLTEHRPRAAAVEANVHHSASKPPSNHASCDETVRGIDYEHHAKGWAGIGYHRVLCTHGTVFEARPLDVVPAAAFGHNAPIIAYCLLEMDSPAPIEQWSALIDAIDRDSRTLRRALKLTTHQEVTPTQCPGAGIQAQVHSWRVKNGGTIPPLIALTTLQRGIAASLTTALTARRARLLAADRRAVIELRDACEHALHVDV